MASGMDSYTTCGEGRGGMGMAVGGWELKSRDYLGFQGASSEG